VQPRSRALACRSRRPRSGDRAVSSVIDAHCARRARQPRTITPAWRFSSTKCRMPVRMSSPRCAPPCTTRPNATSRSTSSGPTCPPYMSIDMAHSDTIRCEAELERALWPSGRAEPPARTVGDLVGTRRRWPLTGGRCQRSARSSPGYRRTPEWSGIQYGVGPPGLVGETENRPIVMLRTRAANRGRFGL
jgi:hypothetical protein